MRPLWIFCLGEYVSQLGLEVDLLDRFPHQLSGGQLQRANILRALLVNPNILICDEILSQLDMPIKVQILTFLKNWLQEKGHAMIFVSHDQREIDYLSHEVMVLEGGKVISRKR
ncbi:MAG: ATP-binding cassette domain-containing protein [Bacteroidota bacterium]